MELIIIQCKVFLKTFVEEVINLKHTKNNINIYILHYSFIKNKNVYFCWKAHSSFVGK